MAYDNIKSHRKKTGFHPFSTKHIFRKTTGGGCWKEVTLS